MRVRHLASALGLAALPALALSSLGCGRLAPAPQTGVPAPWPSPDAPVAVAPRAAPPGAPASRPEEQDSARPSKKPPVPPLKPDVLPPPAPTPPRTEQPQAGPDTARPPNG